jgi:hypothetical protein
MMNSENGMQTLDFQPTRLALHTRREGDSASCPSEALPLPPQMLELFEQLTGWVVEFQETPASFKNRQLPSMDEKVAEGSIAIVDMSPAWPAKKPTAHRAKCDQFVGCVQEMLVELQQTKARLLKAQSQLESYSPGSVDDDEAELVDSFIPRYNDSDWDNEFEVVADPSVHISSDPNPAAVDPPFEGWRLGGAPGMFGGRYVDWNLSGDERINLILGQIETLETLHEGEAVLTVDPLTNEYFVSGDEGFDFYIYDQKNQNLATVEATTQYRQLKPSQMLILSTSTKLSKLRRHRDVSLEGSLDEVVATLQKIVGATEQFLVLKRS